jgi:serine/threonine protein kinase
MNCQHMVTDPGKSLPSLEYIPVPGEWEREAHPNWPDKVFQVPDVVRPGQVYYVRKGFFVDMGSTALIERLPSGGVVKTPLKDPLNPVAERMNRQNVEYEAAVYRLLGAVHFVPRLLDWDPVACTLTLEYQRNGSLDAYLKGNPNTDLATRLRWARQAAEALAGLHARRIVHADVAPRNFLLNETLDLRVCDFAGSSIPERRIPPSSPGARYQTRPWGSYYVPVETDDIFGLGSVFYCIMNGEEIFSDLEDDEIETRFRMQQFPSEQNFIHDIMLECWVGSLTTATAVADALPKSSEGFTE